jgi:hypothetical protein
MNTCPTVRGSLDTGRRGLKLESGGLGFGPTGFGGLGRSQLKSFARAARDGSAIQVEGLVQPCRR